MDVGVITILEFVDPVFQRKFPDPKAARVTDVPQGTKDCVLVTVSDNGLTVTVETLVDEQPKVFVAMTV